MQNKRTKLVGARRSTALRLSFQLAFPGRTD